VEERTRELTEARAEVLDLYRELGKRNQELHDLLARLLDRPADTAQVPQQRPVGVDAVTPPTERLTPREHEVLRHVAQGLTNGEIAAALVVSVATVKFHVEHVIAKLGVADRTQAAVRAVELGYLAPARDTVSRQAPVSGRG
jgi:DNA-binding NarL/FixJ family response regulator